MLYDRMRWLAGTSAIVFIAACAGSIVPEYESARALALADPPPLPADWRPDAVLLLSNEQIDRVVTTVLDQDGTFEDEIRRSALGIEVVARPAITVKGLELGPSKRCATCVAVDADLAGDVRWAVGNRKGTVPVKANVAFDLELAASELEGAWSVTAAPRDVRKLVVQIGDVDASIAQLLEGGLGEALRQDLLKDLQPIELGAVGGTDLPLRAVRLETADAGVAVAMLTRSPTPGRVEARPKAAANGFSLAISQDSLLDIARAQSFAAGAVSHDVIVEPTSLVIDGERFTMGLRFWRPVGKGWWRDYTVTGELERVRRGLRLAPKEVTEGPKSEGAGLVDPIALLAEGLILKAIEDAVATTLPLKQTSRAGDYETDIDVKSVEGQGEALVVTGELDVSEAKPTGRRVPAR